MNQESGLIWVAAQWPIFYPTDKAETWSKCAAVAQNYRGSLLSFKHELDQKIERAIGVKAKPRREFFIGGGARKKLRVAIKG